MDDSAGARAQARLTMVEAARHRRLAERSLVLASIILCGYLCWPLCIGQMPLSADHPVHLARIVEVASAWQAGAFGGWSEMWFLGFPIGQFYPPLGDLWIIAIRTLSFGLLSWPQAYALGLVGVIWVYGASCARLAKQVTAAWGLNHGYQILAGYLALFAALLDPGYYREGGWSYTMDYGVWPQCLSTAMLWLGLAELAREFGPPDQPGKPDATEARLPACVRAGLWFGAALLAHPVAMPSLAMAVVLSVLLCLRHQQYLRSLPRLLAAPSLGLALSAWWLYPLLKDRAWMASYGWLHASLRAMLHWASEGRFTQAMPTLVGLALGVGLLMIALRGNIFARFVAAVAVLHWCLACRESYWLPRLDYLSEGFRHIQYQRFLMAAKPGFFAIASLSLCLAARGLHRVTPKRYPWIAGLGLGLIYSYNVATAGLNAGVGQIEQRRMAGTQVIVDDDYDALCQYFRAQSETSPVTVSFIASRNSHWYMDFPACSGARVYKQGFTPGANFVHKPESKHKAVLDAAHVEYIVSSSSRRPRGADEIKVFGALRVFKRDISRERVHLASGGPEARVSNFKQSGTRFSPRLSFDIRGLAPGGGQVRFDIAGHPRWQLRVDDKELAWLEAPIVGSAPATTQALREQGGLRDGRAEGNDGRTPTRLAVHLAHDGHVELRWLGAGFDRYLAYLLSLTAGLLIGLLALSRFGSSLRRRASSTLERPYLVLLARYQAWSLRPKILVQVALGLCLVSVVGLRWSAGRAVDTPLLSSQIDADRGARLKRSRVAPLKTDMVIRPALRMRARAQRDATAQLSARALPSQLTGWVALDDDWAQDRTHRARHELRIEARPPGGSWRELLRTRVYHRPGRQPLEFDGPGPSPHELRIRLQSDGSTSTQLGVELRLTPR